MTSGAAMGTDMTQAKIEVPSGQEITFQEVIMDASGPQGLTARFRFLAPSIARDGGTIGIDAASVDMEALCRNFAVPALATSGDAPAQVIITLSDRSVPFGVTDPDATQFFDAYKLDGENCIWEGY